MRYNNGAVYNIIVTAKNILAPLWRLDAFIPEIDIETRTIIIRSMFSAIVITFPCKVPYIFQVLMNRHFQSQNVQRNHQNVSPNRKPIMKKKNMICEWNKFDFKLIRKMICSKRKWKSRNCRKLNLDSRLKNYRMTIKCFTCHCLKLAGVIISNVHFADM